MGGCVSLGGGTLVLPTQAWGTLVLPTQAWGSSGFQFTAMGGLMPSSFILVALVSTLRWSVPMDSQPPWGGQGGQLSLLPWEGGLRQIDAGSATCSGFSWDVAGGTAQDNRLVALLWPLARAGCLAHGHVALFCVCLLAFAGIFCGPPAKWFKMRLLVEVQTLGGRSLLLLFIFLPADCDQAPCYKLLNYKKKKSGFVDFT